MENTSPYYLTTVPNNMTGLAEIGMIREALKGTGFGLSLFARNPNRKQFYKDQQRTNWDGTIRKHYYQQNLPREHATSFALYLRSYLPQGTNSTTHDRLVKGAKAAVKLCLI